MTHRKSLDREMRRTLAQLELISAIPASQPASSASTEHPGGRKPPGDKGHTHYAHWYGPPFHHCDTACRHRQPVAATDHEREKALSAARQELQHLRHGKPADTATLETPAQARNRMLNETEGWTPEQVETSSWPYTRFQVRRFRVATGRDAETGKHLDDLAAEAENLAVRARELRARGWSLRQIGTKLGKDQKQIQRYLRKAA